MFWDGSNWVDETPTVVIIVAAHAITPQSAAAAGSWPKEIAIGVAVVLMSAALLAAAATLASSSQNRGAALDWVDAPAPQTTFFPAHVVNDLEPV